MQERKKKRKIVDDDDDNDGGDENTTKTANTSFTFHIANRQYSLFVPVYVYCTYFPSEFHPKLLLASLFSLELVFAIIIIN